MRRHRIRLPATDPHQLDQDQAYFLLTEPSGEEVKLRLHDYDAIYNRPGLYEQLFYDRLKCCSPKKVIDILHYTVSTAGDSFSELRVLDLGAGNGMVGDELRQHGVARIHVSTLYARRWQDAILKPILRILTLRGVSGLPGCAACRAKVWGLP